MQPHLNMDTKKRIAVNKVNIIRLNNLLLETESYSAEEKYCLLQIVSQQSIFVAGQQIILYGGLGIEKFENLALLLCNAS